MPNRRINSRRIKIHRSYTVTEAADALGVHKSSVRLWIKKGLPIAEERHPALLLGTAIHKFLDDRKAKQRHRLAPGEFYCFKCRAAKSPAAGMADYVPASPTLGNLKGLCPDCETIMNRRTSLAKLDYAKGNLDVMIGAGSATPKREA